MQQLFDAHYPSLDIEIVGINEVGRDANNAGVCQGRDIPWLQDVDVIPRNGVSDVWYDSWHVTYRDVIIVDEDNNEVATYNLTTFDLGDSENFETLRDMFVEEAVEPPETEWQSPIEKLDVDANGFVAARDALVVINHIQDYPGGVLPPLNGAEPDFYYDTTGEGVIAARDAILVINHLIRVNTAESSAPLSAGPESLDETGIESAGVVFVAPQSAEQVSAVAPAGGALAGDAIESTSMLAAVDTVPESWAYDEVAESRDAQRAEARIHSMWVLDAAFADLR
jgi:hypothetical protein